MTELQVRTHAAMGLPFSLHVRAGSAADTDARAARMWAELDQWDGVFSTYRSDSDIARLDRGELPPGDCHPAVAEVLELADRARELTGGLFDIRGAGRLDPSGIVKGWAAESAFWTAELGNAYLNAGGDLALSGPPGSWRIGIEHPADPRGLLTAVTIGSGSVATSGRAHRGAHLWDPSTGRPAESRWQATVVGPSLCWADILATAAAVGGPDRLELSRWPAGYQVLLADPAGIVWATPGFLELLARDLPALVVDGWL